MEELAVFLSDVREGGFDRRVKLLSKVVKVGDLALECVQGLHLRGQSLLGEKIGIVTLINKINDLKRNNGFATKLGCRLSTI